MTFEELVKKALEISTTEEGKKRIEEEKAYIESRGWQKYIAFCTNVVKGIKSSINLNQLYTLQSSLDCFILHCNVFGSENEKNFLNDIKKKNVFFNDLLKLNLSIHKMFKSEVNPHELDSLLKVNLESEGLYYIETLRPAKNEFNYGAPDAKENLILISTQPIPPEDFEVVKRYRYEALTQEEEKTAMKYLILKIQLFEGL